VDRHHARLLLLIGVEQLSQPAAARGRLDDRIAQEHGKRLPAHVIPAEADGIPQAELLLLPDEMGPRQVSDVRT